MPPLHATHPTADRNLLFGILALQMDFIRQEDLVGAMNAWILEKAKPLGRILVERGALAEDTRMLIEALVQKHVELHGSSIQQSLAAVHSAAAVPEKLQEISDAEIQATLGTLSKSRERNEDPFVTLLPNPVGTQTSSGQRFRVLRPHARGGLGEVFAALDEELHREVALKHIRAEHADHHENRERFLLEARVTGWLEHPGIIPVYGLGQYPDGRPFYAMRFIRGESLQQAIDHFYQPDGPGNDPVKRPFEFRKLLGRFINVCNAIAYAHSRGVLHRDIKPANIMLGPFGETLVVDWGLAKVLGKPDSTAVTEWETLQVGDSASGSETIPGSVIGTPAYMSPEQASGKLAELGPGSDIYSLGATFFSLLTGRPPVEDRALDVVLRKVEHGLIPTPKEVNPRVDPNLQAICMKAMALNPVDRYSSAAAFAEALERWLADEPFSGYQDCIFSVSIDAKFIAMSPSFESLFGWPRSEWIGNSFGPLIHPEDLPLVMTLQQNAVQGQRPQIFQARIALKLGGFRLMEFACIVRMQEGVVIGLMGIGRPLD